MATKSVLILSILLLLVISFKAAPSAAEAEEAKSSAEEDDDLSFLDDEDDAAASPPRDPYADLHNYENYDDLDDSDSASSTGDGYESYSPPAVDEKDVVVLKEANFSDFIANNRYVMVEFYAPWCGHCQSLAPEYAAAATALKEEEDKVVLAKVDATEENELAQKYEVQGYPTVFFFVDGIHKPYTGQRTKDAIVSWVKKKTGPALKNITTTEEAENILAAGTKVVLGFLDTLVGSSSEELAAVSIIEDDVSFYQTSNPDVAKLFEIDPQAKRPALVLIKKEAEKINHFGGQFTKTEITDFVYKNKLPLVNYFSRDNAPQIFENPIKKQLLLFATSNDSEKFLPTFQEAAKAFKGKLLCVYVEMDNEDFGKPVADYFGIQGDAPRVLAYTGNDDARKFLLDGDLTLSNIKLFGEKFLQDELKPFFKSDPVPEKNDGDVKIVVGNNFDEIVLDESKDVLLEIYAPWCGHCQISLSEKQAEAIFDISLRRLTLLERNKFVEEGKSLREQISKLEELLSSKKRILQLIEEEAIELKKKFSTPRRSTLEDSDSAQVGEIDVIPNEEMLLAISEKGYVKRMKPDTFSLQHRGTIGKSVGKLKVNDTMSDFLVCRAHDHILYFSDKGIVYSARAYKIPECSRAAAGVPLIQILSLSDGERITSIIPVNEFSGDQYLVMLTVKGYIKKVSMNYFSSIRSTGIIAIQLVPGDELKWVKRCSNDDLIAMASQNGMVILSSCDSIRALGRNTRGSVAMRLKGEDKVASMDIIPSGLRKNFDDLSESRPSSYKGLTGPWLLFVSENGFGKRVPLSSFRMSSLNRIGLIGYKFAFEDRLAAVFVVGFSLGDDGESDEQVVLVSQSGTVNRIKVRDISIQSRFARGVILMRLDHAGKIQSVSLISGSETDSDETEAENEVEVGAA